MKSLLYFFNFIMRFSKRDAYTITYIQVSNRFVFIFIFCFNINCYLQTKHPQKQHFAVQSSFHMTWGKLVVSPLSAHKMQFRCIFVQGNRMDCYFIQVNELMNLQKKNCSESFLFLYVFDKLFKLYEYWSLLTTKRWCNFFFAEHTAPSLI